MKIKLASLLATTLVAAFAIAQPNISVTIDGQPVTFGEVGPMRSQGRVLVPLRGCLEQLGATVEWDGASQTVTAQRDDKKIEITVGKAFARINDNDVPLDAPARVFKGTTMVPLRFMGSALGARVRWDESKSTVEIQTKD